MTQIEVRKRLEISGTTQHDLIRRVELFREALRERHGHITSIEWRYEVEPRAQFLAAVKYSLPVRGLQNFPPEMRSVARDVMAATPAVPSA